MWEFGLTELIQSIAALLTFLAIVTSLYLATKSKTLKFKIINEKLNKSMLIQNEYHKIVLLNNGHIQFTVVSVGYYINKKYYFCYHNMAIKKLDQVRHTETISASGNKSKSSTGQDNLLLPTYLKEGECLDLGLMPADFNFLDSKKNKKVYYYILINGKAHKIYSGMKENEFYKICKNLKKKSLQHQASNVNARSLNDVYFRY